MPKRLGKFTPQIYQVYTNLDKNVETGIYQVYIYLEYTFMSYMTGAYQVYSVLRHTWSYTWYIPGIYHRFKLSGASR